MSSDVLIGKYKLLQPFCNKNSGNSVWTFAKFDRVTYFIKQFLTPVCPTDADNYSIEYINATTEIGKEFFKNKSEIYKSVNEAANGNIIKIEDFFRYKAKYYITTKKVDVNSTDVNFALKRNGLDKLLFLKLLTNSLLELHNRDLIYNDLKPDNIIIKESPTGKLIPKLIDFDSCFFQGRQPLNWRAIGCDNVYSSPEFELLKYEEDVEITTKVDIFSLGILFHQYLTGKLPMFERDDDCRYLCQAILDDKLITLDKSLDEDMNNLIFNMIASEPERRYSALEVKDSLNKTGNMNNDYDFRKLWKVPV